MNSLRKYLRVEDTRFKKLKMQFPLYTKNFKVLDKTYKNKNKD